MNGITDEAFDKIMRPGVCASDEIDDIDSITDEAWGLPAQLDIATDVRGAAENLRCAENQLKNKYHQMVAAGGKFNELRNSYLNQLEAQDLFDTENRQAFYMKFLKWKYARQLQSIRN